MYIVWEGEGGDWAVLPECSQHGEEVLHGGGLHGGLNVPGMLLLLCSGSVV
jgi:hypothetical protein